MDLSYFPKHALRMTEVINASLKAVNVTEVKFQHLIMIHIRWLVMKT